METMKQIKPEFKVNLTSLLDGRSEAWGTDLGARVFGTLNLRLMGLGEGTLVPVDYAGLERTDVSFQREAVVETVRKHRPRLLFVVVNLVDQDVRTNLEHALDRRGDSVIALEPDGGRKVLGKKLSEEQQATLERVWELGEATSALFVREAAETGRDEKLSTASSRLTALWKAGLLERVEGSAATGGREHRYYPIG